jgi:predicted alpha/beta hydrolase
MRTPEQEERGVLPRRDATREAGVGWKEAHCEADDGQRLGLRRIDAEQPQGVALLLHAMMADGRSLDRPSGEGMGSVFAASGWTTLLPDFRGRGLSPAERYDYDQMVRYDLPAFVRFARQLAGGGPVVVVGHSLGGHVTGASVGLGWTDVDALVLLASNVWQMRLERSVRWRLAKRAAVSAFSLLATGFEHVPARRLGMGSVDEHADYVQDIVRYALSDRWGSRDGVWDYTAAIGHVDRPLLAVLGVGDTLLGRAEGALAWADQFGRKPEVWLVGEGRYGVEGCPGHMDLGLDPACAPMWRQLATWLRDATA